MNTRTLLLTFGGGIGLGAVVTTLSFSAWLAAQPGPRVELAPTMCPAPEACPACPACPEPTLVRDPPAEGSIAEPAPAFAGTMLTQRECDRARQRPMQVSDAKLAECARGGLLGTCHLKAGAVGAPCAEYASVDGICDAQNVCGAPLQGNGCVDEAHHGSKSSFFNCSGDNETVAGCMMRKLAKAGYCKPAPKP